MKILKLETGKMTWAYCYRTWALITITTLSLYIESISSLPDTEDPVITVENRAWTILDKKNLTLIGRVGYQLTLKCVAPYPIKWEYTGYQTERPFRVWNPKTAIKNGKLMYILHVVNQFPKLASFEIVCKHYNNSLFSSARIFVPEAEESHFKNVSTRIENNVIPCPTTDPRILVELYFRNSTNLQQILAPYHPNRGFLLSSKPNVGSYICRMPTNSLSFQVDSDDNKRTQNDVNLRTKFLPFGEYIHLRCNDDGTFTSITLRNLLTTLKVNSNADISLNSGEEVIIGSLNNSEVSSVNCYDIKGVHTEVLQYHFIDPPKVVFNSRAGEMDCISETEQKTIASLRCANTNDCNLLRYCFDDPTCKKKKDLYFYSDLPEGFCPSANFSSCTSLQNYHYNGLVECAVLNHSKSFVFEFFTGLRLIKYKSAEEAPKEELINMDEVSETLYFNESSYFFCEAVKFLFADTFHYYLTYSNGSIVYLDTKYYKEDKGGKTERRRILDFNILSGINLFLPINAVKLTCSVSLMDKPILFNASRKFAVKYLSPPVIEKNGLEVTLIKGREGRLVCKAKGEPLPVMSWTRVISENTTTLIFKSTYTSKKDEVLEFANVDESISGVYECHAWNRLGNDSVKFIVKVKEPMKTTTFIVIVVAIVAILLLMVLSLYNWRQQKIQEYLRELSDEEIKEFLNGNNEIWNVNDQITQDKIAYMPYNKELEIPIGSISMDNKIILLGSGRNGIVFRAMYNLNEVAVKATKPATADIFYFKSLLTELKTMMYLGEHENIVKLLGACTENIKMRSLSVVYEVCSLGDLQRHLLNNKDNFVSESDPRYVNILEDNTIITPNDLLQWSYQIACGMEYLTLKNIVHANLATKNVLLTEDKIAKLSDFGLHFQLYKENNYIRRKKVPLPFRWMAIESLKHLQFSIQSDVWSYGVTIWEIYSLGDIPFPKETWNSKFIVKLSAGLRLTKPILCSHGLYNFVMKKSWDIDTSQRPSFGIIKNYLKSLMDNKIDTLAIEKSKPSDKLFVNVPL